MAYNSNIPQPADQLKNSQPQLLANFQEINTALNVNHVGFNVADEGKHKFIQFPQQIANPNTNPTEYAMFSKAGLYSGSTEALFRKPNNGSTVNVTEYRFGASDGWWQLPSGIIVKYVRATIPATLNTSGINVDFVWPVVDSIPFTTAPFNYYFTLLGDTNQNIRLIPSVDATLTTNLRMYFRLNTPTASTINVSAFDIVVTAYGI